MNQSEETEEIKTFPCYPLPAARTAGLATTVSQYQLDTPETKIHNTFALPNHPPSAESAHSVLSIKFKKKC